MATTAKDKVKRPTSQPNENISQARRATTTKPALGASASDKGLSFLSEKPSPHYLKPTISSNKDAFCKYGKTQAVDDTSLKYNSQSRRRSIDKPPSPSALQRTLSASPRVRPIKPSSPPPRKMTVSPKQPLTTSKSFAPPRNGKSTPVLTKAATMKKPTGTSTNTSTSGTGTKKVHRVAKTTPIGTIVSTTIVEAIETPPPSVKSSEGEEKSSEGEEKDEVVVQEVQEEMDKDVREEGNHVEAAPNDSMIEHHDHEAEKNNHSTSVEENGSVSDHSLEGSQEQKDEQMEIDNEKDEVNEEHTHENEECQKDTEEGKLEEEKTEVEGNEGDEEGSEHKGKKASIEGEGEEEKPYTVKFKQSRELEEKDEEIGGGLQRLKFMEKKEVGTEGVEVQKGEAENVVLKKQESQSKKESPAYNAVIEETASKLAEKRKSKVKALVGAFETVISLQEPEGQQDEDKSD